MASPRSVAVALLLIPPTSVDIESPTFLLCSSRKHRNRWVFPKGGVEQGESTEQAALREAWEEAGLKPGQASHLTHLLSILDPSPHILSPTTDPLSPSFVPSSKYDFELFLLPRIHAVPDTDGTDTSPAPSSARPPIRLDCERDEETLARVWPEHRERARTLTHGWHELEEKVCWGRREGVMRAAVERAKEYLVDWQDQERTPR